MEEKESLKTRIVNFFNDDKKRSIFILIVVITLLLTIIGISLLLTNNKKVPNQTSTTKKITTLTKNTNDNYFRGYKEVELKSDDSYDLDLASRHEIIYANNKVDQIVTCIDDLDLIYEVRLVDGALEFKELRHDEGVNGEVYTGEIYKYKANKKITNFVIGHNCSDIEYNILVSDEDNNLYAYENTIESQKSIKEIISSIKKVKTISTPKKIGYYNYNNDPFMSCPLTKMVYVDKSNNIRTLDEKNTLFFNTVFYRYIGNDGVGEVIYVLKDKTMKLSNKQETLNNDGKNINYRGSFYTEDAYYIIDDQNYIYKINSIDEDSSTNIKPFTNFKIKRIGSRIIGENNFATEKNSVVIEFENNEIMKFDVAYEYEILV